MIIGISLCDSSDYDTEILVTVNGVDDSNFVAANDDCCPHYRSWVRDLSVTPGNIYYIIIDGYINQAGNYFLCIYEEVPPPPCNEPLFGQNGQGPVEDYLFGLSDFGEPDQQIVIDNFINAGTVQGMTFWGINYSLGSSCCFEEVSTFEIKIYEDNGGLPGGEIQSYETSAEARETYIRYLVRYLGYNYWDTHLYEYYVTLDPPVTLDTGWISIQGVSDPQDCLFGWLSSSGYDSLSYFVDLAGPDTEAVAIDFAFCLYGSPLRIDNDISCPRRADLLTAYPNPFNSTTTFKYSVVEPAIVEIAVFNPLGKLVQTLVHEAMQPGEYSITWDASELASGIYFTRLMYGNYSRTIKSLYVK